MYIYDTFPAQITTDGTQRLMNYEHDIPHIR